MNTTHALSVFNAAIEAGDILKPHMSADAERNSYAHVFHSIKEQFGDSYKNLPDSLVQDVLSHIQSLRVSIENRAV